MLPRVNRPSADSRFASVHRRQCASVGRPGPGWISKPKSAGRADTAGDATVRRRPASTPARDGGADGKLVGVDEHTTDVLAVAHVLVALIDVAQLVGLGDHAIEVELTVPIQLQ
jgi:hypothetical protein